METSNLLSPELQEKISAGHWSEVRNIVCEWAEPDIADLLLELDDTQRFLLFRSLPRDIGAEVFAYLEYEDQDRLVRRFSDAELAELLGHMDADDRTAFFEELPAPVTVRLMSLLPPDELKVARQLLGYPEESVGRLMNPDYIAIRAHWSVERAMDHVRRWGQDIENINLVYVRDAQGKLLDELRLRDLVLADPAEPITELMDENVASVSAFDDREVAVRTMQRYDYSALPVVDSQGVLIGMVTFDDLFDVAEEEATEDFHKGAAVGPLRVSYDRASSFMLYQKRVGWLMLLVVLNLVSSSVIAVYEEVLEAAIALAFFIPLLTDSCGNTGAQSATLMIRALVTGDVELKDWAKTLAKEVSVGIMLGVSLGLLSMVLGIFRGGPAIGFVVGVTMVSVVLLSNLLGAILPFILTRLKLDPATASGPLITSIADALGLLIYFSIATAVLDLG